MALPILALAAKLLPFAAVIPDVMRAFGSDKSAEAADAMVRVARVVTGESDGETAANRIINDPALQLQYQQMLSGERIKFSEMAYQDKQHAHQQQQETIRGGDSSDDTYVRHTRPKMARQSWYGTFLYVSVFEVLEAYGKGTGADWDIALILLSPAAAYLGFRTGDKFAEAWKSRKQ